MISLKNLGKIYSDDDTDTTALQDISFEIKKGEFVSVMGPSGSGKSTLLHILSFLDRPTSGSYTFSGKSINDLSDIELARIRNKEMGFVFQAFNLLSRASVYENVEMPLIYSVDLPAGERAELVRKAIEAVGLKEKTFVEAGRLSGGQKQRVAIARALVNDPNVIFADEPTGNLDSKSGAQIMEILDDLHNAGRTIILVTHETYTAEFADRRIQLKDGLVEVDEATKHDGNRKEFFK
ncbi:MAG: ABC transporter ATP-binding protein [Candidatus Liptonbacteria bacterium]|nr:ABC transporter ATP-binding protein [Candidatus Liptonbacteria bacterium]